MATINIDFGKLEAMAVEKSERGVLAAALQGEAILKADLLSRPGTGRKYGKHVASAPGHPPAPDTGRLRNATAADQVVRHEADAVVGRVVANTEYAHWLEVGTERMAARPYLSKLRDEHADQLRAAFMAGAKG